MKQVLAETKMIPILFSVRDSEVGSWLELGWELDGPAVMAGWQRLEWSLPEPAVAPLSAILKNSSKHGSVWSKYFREVKWDAMPCFVYLIREAGTDGLTKVGIASDVKLRLKQHQAGNSRLLSIEETWHLPTREAAHDLEQLIVKEFTERCRRGNEWLAVPVEEVSAFIKGIITKFGIRGVERIAPERAFVAPPEIFERLVAAREI